MIDFVSTRPGVAPETIKAARFLASVVAASVREAASKPSCAELAAGRNLSPAQQAIEYLFGSDSAMDDHLEMLGGCAATMRTALLSDRVLGGNAGFTEDARATIQLRRTWWIASRAALFNDTPQGEPTQALAPRQPGGPA